MDGEHQPKRRTVRNLAIAFLLLLVAKLALEVPVDMGWIKNRSAAAVLGGGAVILNVLLVLLLFAVIGGWPASTKAGRRAKTFNLMYLVLYILGGVARRLGFSDWLKSRGRTVDVAFYTLSNLVMIALLVVLTALMVKDLEEQTNQDIQAKLQGRTEASDQEPSPSEIA